MKKSPPTAQQVNRWVKQLDAESFVVREAATRNLIESSHLAIEPISKVVDQGNPELNWRGVIVLKRLMENPDLDVVEAAETALTNMANPPLDLLQKATELGIGRNQGIIPLHYQVNTWAGKKGLAYKARTDERTKRVER